VEQENPDDDPQGSEKQPEEQVKTEPPLQNFASGNLPAKVKAKTPSRFRRRLERQGQGLIIEFVGLIGFLLILWAGDWAVNALWGPSLLFEHGHSEGIPVKWIFDVGDIALVLCFTVRSCMRIFGIIEEEEE
jgi:hypothetical protein